MDTGMNFLRHKSEINETILTMNHRMDYLPTVIP